MILTLKYKTNKIISVINNKEDIRRKKIEKSTKKVLSTKSIESKQEKRNDQCRTYQKSKEHSIKRRKE
jgi:hypothetical protein